MERVQRISLVRWSLPPHSKFKLNTDGASRGNPGVAGGGGVLRDHNGSMLLAYAFNYGVTTNFAAEFLAIFDGLRICRALQLPVHVIEVDSLSLASILLQQSYACVPVAFLDLGCSS